MNDEMKMRAREMRLAGMSTPQIARALGVRSHRTIGEWVQGLPIPEWTTRPNAKNDLRARARALRLEGRSYREIRAEVPVAKSTLSDWLKDVPISEEQAGLLRARSIDGNQRRATALRARRIATQQRIRRESAAQIGSISERDLLIAGVIAYWAEGSKSKPWRNKDQVKFINSDPTMIRLFIRWLELLGFGPADSSSGSRSMSEPITRPPCDSGPKR